MRLSLALSLKKRGLELTPLAVSDFKNGIYSIGGVSKTAGQMWVENASDWAAFDPVVDIVAGVGLITRDSGLYGPTATAALLAAVPPTAAFTVVIDCILIGSARAVVECDEFPGYTSVTSAQASTISGTYFVADNSGNASAAIVAGTHRLAATLSQNPLRISKGGAAALSLASAENMALLDNIGVAVEATAGGGGPDDAIIEKITFYAPQNAAMLALLSA